MKLKEQKITSLIPKTEGTELIGKLMYSERDQAWSTIRLKKEILQRFPQLFEKRSMFGYKMNIFQTFEGLMKNLKELQKQGEEVPLIITLCRRED